jgi:hypothetical protein
MNTEQSEPAKPETGTLTETGKSIDADLCAGCGGKLFNTMQKYSFRMSSRLDKKWSLCKVLLTKGLHSIILRIKFFKAAFYIANLLTELHGRGEFTKA